MKKQLLALCLALALALPLAAPAAAAEYTSENFQRVKSYAGEFSDVLPSSTFYDNAVALFEYGLSIGKSNGTFGLGDPVTVGQVVIFAGRIRSLYATGDPEAGAAPFQGAGLPAYAPYLLYLQSEGLLGQELEGAYFTAASRAQVAHVLAGLLPEAVLPAVNNELVTQAYASRQYITDVTEYTPYYQDILRLYEAGVSVGSNAQGDFLPDQPITRGATAAMLTRMVDPALRLAPDWALPEQPEDATSNSPWRTTWQDLLNETPVYISAPYTDQEIAQSVAYMLYQESPQLDLHYGHEVSAAFVNQVMNTALQIVKSHCEQLYNAVECSYNPKAGAVTFLFSALSTTDGELAEYRAETLEYAVSLRDRMWADGVITEQTTELEKARIYYTWICDNCVYDHSAGNASISHIAYSLFSRGQAVCDGYTGAYNLLLKLEGIDCYALSNDDHIWTVALLDGTEYHIDVTWGDEEGTVNYTYFAMTEAQSWAHHSW